jgi:hypothetical protein
MTEKYAAHKATAMSQRDSLAELEPRSSSHTCNDPVDAVRERERDAIQWHNIRREALPANAIDAYEKGHLAVHLHVRHGPVMRDRHEWCAVFQREEVAHEWVLAEGRKATNGHADALAASHDQSDFPMLRGTVELLKLPETRTVEFIGIRLFDVDRCPCAITETPDPPSRERLGWVKDREHEFVGFGWWVGAVLAHGDRIDEMVEARPKGLNALPEDASPSHDREWIREHEAGAVLSEVRVVLGHDSVGLVVDGSLGLSVETIEVFLRGI